MDEKQLLELLKTAYFAAVPVTRGPWTLISRALDVLGDILKEEKNKSKQEEDLAHQVVECILQHQLAITYPRNPHHCKQVLDWLRQQWKQREWSGQNVFQRILDEQKVNVGQDPLSDLYYKTYFGWDGSNCSETAHGVTLLESGDGITHGTTGLTTWCGAAVLADWVTLNPQVISGKNVLELGSGLGFTGVALLRSSKTPPASYTFTDCHPHVLDILLHNVTLNLGQPQLQNLRTFTATMTSRLEEDQLQPGDIGTTPWANGVPVPVSGSSTFFVSQLDWRKPPRLQPVDVVLAADVVYAHHLIPPLVSLLRELLCSIGTTEDKIAAVNIQKSNTYNSIKTNRKLLSSTGTTKDDITAVDIQNLSTYSSARANTSDLIAHRNQLRTRDSTVHKQKNNKASTNATMRRFNNNATTTISMSSTSPMKRITKNTSKNDPNVISATLVASADAANTTSPCSKPREAFIACTRRNQETLNTFLTALCSEGLNHQLVYQTNSETALFGYNESYMPVKVFRITAKNSDA